MGHTHEDIDAIFAIIWQFLKNKKVMTPQIYANLLALACQNKANSVDHGRLDDPNVVVSDFW